MLVMVVGRVEMVVIVVVVVVQPWLWCVIQVAKVGSKFLQVHSNSDSSCDVLQPPTLISRQTMYIRDLHAQVSFIVFILFYSTNVYVSRHQHPFQVTRTRFGRLATSPPGIYGCFFCTSSTYVYVGLQQQRSKRAVAAGAGGARDVSRFEPQVCFIVFTLIHSTNIYVSSHQHPFSGPQDPFWKFSRCWPRVANCSQIDWRWVFCHATYPSDPSVSEIFFLFSIQVKPLVNKLNTTLA